jgi:hypothetical protein
VIALDDFEADFCRKLELALRRALGDALLELDARPLDDSQLGTRSAFELLELFAWTGSLPWWADNRRRGVVAEALRALVDAPGEHDLCRRLVVALSARREALARLVRAGDDATLAALIERISGASLARIVARLVSRPPLALAGPDLRERAWVLALTRASSTGEPGTKVARLFEALERERPQWRRAALLEALADRELEAMVAAQLERGDHRREPAAREAARALARELLAQDEAAQALARDASATAPEPASGLVEGPTTEPEPGGVKTSPQPAEPEPGEGETSPQPVGLPMPAADVREHLSWLASAEAATIPAPTRAGLSAALRALLRRGEPRPSPTPPSRPRSLAELDGLPVDNAGLVIVWPFLERLFQRCDLVLAEARTFVDDRARARAVNALQYVACAELDAPEFALPLNKLLCGLEPDAPLDAVGLHEPLGLELLAECERMLAAVIAHAEILGEMSPPQLRASFLRREGMLSTRDGAWLLQVERQPHDLVLDRFVWTWDWLALPWMSAPLRVEW